MPLDPQVKALLDQAAEAGRAPLQGLTVEELRAGMRSTIELKRKGLDVERVDDRELPGPAGAIPVRIYWPGGPAPSPVLVWLHGGGWALGDLDVADSTCRALAVKSGAIVVSVDYRLAPEHKYPAGVDDAYAAALWVVDHAASIGGDPERVAIGGDSAGGNLATVTALQAVRRGGPPLCYQLLVYPVTDASMGSVSYVDNGEGYQLTADAMKWFYDLYLDGGDADDPLVSPIRAPLDELAQLPPALVITAEFDPLRDEGEAYARVLEQAGVPVKPSRYDGQIHGFFAMDWCIDAGKRAVDEAADALRLAFSESGILSKER
jgi:acetyl esterase